MSKQLTAYILFGILTLIWGSAFILIKIGLTVYTPSDVAFVRVAAAGISFLPIAAFTYKKIAKKDWVYVLLSGLLGSLLPAFLFASAQTVVSSGTSGVLSALTPFFSVLIAVIVFKDKYVTRQYIGLALGFAAAISLIFMKGNNFSFDSAKGLLIPVAALCYAVNLNLLKYKLSHLSPLVISANSLLFAIPLSLAGLYFSDFSVRMHETEGTHVLLLLILLGVTSTGVALVLFNKLLQISTPMFASSVTYAIPVVALSWGVLDGEPFTQWLALGMVTIIISLWLISKRKSV